mmetsp:Transcript_10286/g.20295  ORF Transcript_10286/g.20295 Transcript_10286/m.20295 type:complete len:245 (+) Transcript_10286:193-927(+)
MVLVYFRFDHFALARSYKVFPFFSERASNMHGFIVATTAAFWRISSIGRWKYHHKIAFHVSAKGTISKIARTDHHGCYFTTLSGIIVFDSSFIVADEIRVFFFFRHPNSFGVKCPVGPFPIKESGIYAGSTFGVAPGRSRCCCCRPQERHALIDQFVKYGRNRPIRSLTSFVAVFLLGFEPVRNPSSSQEFDVSKPLFQDGQQGRCWIQICAAQLDRIVAVLTASCIAITIAAIVRFSGFFQQI